MIKQCKKMRGYYNTSSSTSKYTLQNCYCYLLFKYSSREPASLIFLACSGEPTYLIWKGSDSCPVISSFPFGYRLIHPNASIYCAQSARSISCTPISLSKTESPSIPITSNARLVFSSSTSSI